MVGLAVTSNSNDLNWGFLLMSLPILCSFSCLEDLCGLDRAWEPRKAYSNITCMVGLKGALYFLCVSVPLHTCLAWQSTVPARPKERTHYYTWKNVLKPSENLLKLRLEAVLFFTCLFLLSCFLTIHVVNISDPEECFRWKPEQKKKKVA